MLKKRLIITLFAACFFSVFFVSALASNRPFTLTFSTFSLNTELTDLSDIDFGYKLQLKYAFNQRYYVKGSVRSYRQKKYGVGLKLGYQYPIRKLMPYVEVGFDEKPKNPGSKVIFVVYNTGLKYKLARHFHPFIEFDNFTIPQRATGKIGASFPLNDRLALAGDYIHGLDSDSDGFELKFSVAF